MSTQARTRFPDCRADTRLIIAVDGEGESIPITPGERSNNPHVFDLIGDGKGGKVARGWHSYTMLAAADDRGHRKSIIHNGARREALYDPTNAANDVARNYGLPTKDCLEFLLDLTKKDPLIVSFYFSYDVVKMLADLPFRRLADLASTRYPDAAMFRQRETWLQEKFGFSQHVIRNSGNNSRGLIAPESTIWQNYYIAYVPRKKLQIIDLSAGRIPDPRNEGRTKWARSVIVWDIFGFYQQSYVAALDGARTATGERLCGTEIIERIKAMKDQRGEFANLPTEKILEYCYDECHYLASMFRDTLRHIETMGLKLNAFHGSGALATAWLKSRKMQQYKQTTFADDGQYWGINPGALPYDVATSAYFGGRFEITDMGYMGDMHSYDINSAYPYIMSTLPCLAHGQWRQVTEHVPGKWGVYRVGSLTDPQRHPVAPCPLSPVPDVPLPGSSLPGGTPGARYAPFPFRPDQDLARRSGIPEHSVLYAHGGQRWVWQDELQVARKHYGTAAIPVHEGWVWEPDCDHLPFSEIPEMFLTRRKLKSEGNGAEKTYKLAYNSFYGKLAQSVGWGLNKDDKIQPPTFQSFIWAGMITSGCRAMILDAACQPDADVTSIATDGILSRTPIAALSPNSKDLGKWEYDKVTDAFLFQSGVYTMRKAAKCTHPIEHDNSDDPCQRVYKTRGFSSKEISHRQLIDAWNAGQHVVSPEGEPTRFVPIKAGVLRNGALDFIGQWIPSVHDVEFNHTRRIPDVTLDEWGMPTVDDTVSVLGSMPFTVPDDSLSVPYSPKQTWADVLEEQELLAGSGDYLDATPDDIDAITTNTQIEEMP